MSKVGIFMADGCEEIEGLTVVDLLRRAGVEITMISITDSTKVTGAHDIVFEADAVKADVDFASLDGIILPGGMPGTLNLGADETVVSTIKEFAKSGKLVAAICAAPSVLGDNGILSGKSATCYPGFENRLTGAKVKTRVQAVRDGNIITSRGMGTAIPFGLAIISYFSGKQAAKFMAQSVVYE